MCTKRTICAVSAVRSRAKWLITDSHLLRWPAVFEARKKKAGLEAENIQRGKCGVSCRAAEEKRMFEYANPLAAMSKQRSFEKTIDYVLQPDFKLKIKII